MYFAPPKSKKGRRAVGGAAGGGDLALREHRRRQAEGRLAAGPAWDDQGQVFTTEVGGLLRHFNIPERAEGGEPAVDADLRSAAQSREPTAGGGGGFEGGE